MMTFRDFDDTEFHKVLMELFDTPETETGELRTSDSGFTLQPLGFDFIMYLEEHCTYQTKLKSHMIDLGRIDWHCSTRLVLTKTESHLWINGELTKVRMSDSFGLDWLCFKLLTVFLTLSLNKRHMTKQQEMPRHCLGQMNPLTNNEQHTISHTYHIGHGVNIVWSPKVVRITQNVKLTDSPSFKLTTVLSILDLTLDNGLFSLLWTFKLDLLLLLLFQTKVDINTVLRNWRSSSTKLDEHMEYCNTTKSQRWKHWSLTYQRN